MPPDCLEKEWLKRRFLHGLSPNFLQHGSFPPIHGLSRIFTLLVLGVICASTVTAAPNSVVLTWTAPGDDGNTGTATTYDIRYSTATITAANWASATQVTGETAPKVAGSAESFTVNNLTPSTTYYFAIKAADEAGNWSTLSNIITKSTTAETTPPSAVANLTTNASTNSSVSLTWSSPGDDGSSGTATTYDIRYSTATITDANWASATQATGETAPKVSGSTETFVITGLNPSTTYYFAIKTADEVPNWSALSNVTSRATSAESTAPSAVANLGAGSETVSSVTLTWTSPGDDGNTGTATTYDVRYSTASITAANFASATAATGEPAPKVAGSAETFVVSGLNSNALYYFAVKTADEVPNWSSISNVVTRTTLTETTAPSAVTSLATVSVTSNAVTLSWTAPGDDASTGTATTYDLRYSTSNITAGNFASATQVTGEPAPKAAGGSETFTVTGLSISTTYYFALKTADEVPNWSSMSNVPSATTQGDVTPPSPILDLGAVEGTAAGEVILGWTAPGDDGNTGTARFYLIKYATDSITPESWVTADIFNDPPSPVQAGEHQSVSLYGLVPAQKYYVAMEAYDENAYPSGMSNVASAVAGEGIVANSDSGEIKMVSPANQVLHSSRPILKIENIDTANTNDYTFAVSADSTFESVVSMATVVEELGSTTCWEVPVRLTPNQLYFWRVDAEPGGASAIASFMVQPTTHVYPNPYKASTGSSATFAEVPTGSQITITSVSGETVRQFASIESDQVAWDGLNDSGSPVASGVYLWYLDGGSAKGKIVVTR